MRGRREDRLLTIEGRGSRGKKKVKKRKRGEEEKANKNIIDS